MIRTTRPRISSQIKTFHPFINALQEDSKAQIRDNNDRVEQVCIVESFLPFQKVSSKRWNDSPYRNYIIH